MDTLKRMEELIREGKGHTLAMAVMKLAEPHFTTITDHPYEFEMFKQWSKAYADIVCRGWGTYDPQVAARFGRDLDRLVARALGEVCALAEHIPDIDWEFLADIDLMEHLAAEGEAIIIPQASWNTEDRYVGKPIINLRDPLASQAEAMKLPDEEEDEAQ